jgi:polyisoprenoid-binding protein YceI
VYKIVPGESTVSYEVGETFLDQNRFATAIGVTPEVNGEIRLNPANPQAVSIGDITVDVSQLTSDSARRDGALRDRFLLSSQFPTATFRATTIEGLPTAYIEGQEISFKVTGDLTVRETTLPVTFDVVAILRGSQLTGTATSMIKMSDFGVGPISMAILRTEDDVKLAFKFVARP